MASIIKKGATDVSRYIMIRDSAAGTPETGITINTLDMQYTRNQAAPAAKVDMTALATTSTAHTDNYGIEVDATSSPGLYRVDWPDAAFASGVDKVILVVSGTGFDPAVEEIDLVDVDLADGVRLGLTALPNAAADAAGGLPISDAGGLDIDAKLANTNEVTAARMGALTDWINGGRLDLLLDAVKAVTDALPDAGALTTIGTDTARLTAARAQVLDDWIDAGRLDAILDTIAADTTTDIPALLAAGVYVTSMAANVIGAVQIGTDAIGSDELAASAVTEIRLAIWQQATAEALGVNVMGTLIKDYLDAPVSGANTITPLDAAGVRTAVGLAAANLDTQIAALPTAAETRTEIDANSTQLAAIVADTNELQTDWADGGRLDLLLDAAGGSDVADIKAVTDKLDTAMELDGAEYRFTANALEESPVAAGGGTATIGNQNTIISTLAAIKGTGWSASTDSLVGLRNAITVAVAETSEATVTNAAVGILENEASEEGAYIINVDFTDELGDSITPTAAYWRLTDEDGNIVNGRSNVALAGASDDIRLEQGDLAILKGLDRELRTVTITGFYDSAEFGNDLPFVKAVKFYVRNLGGIASPTPQDLVVVGIFDEIGAVTED